MRRLPLGFIVIEKTLASAPGFQGSSAPVLAETAARRLRAVLLIVEKMPPMYRVELVAAMEVTCASAFTENDVIKAPVLVLTAAMRLAVWPPIVVKLPATYRRLPSGDSAMART